MENVESDDNHDKTFFVIDHHQQIDFDGTDGSSESSTDSTFDVKALILEASSNLSFFVGSGFYVWTAIMDWQWIIKLENSDDDYYAYYDPNLVHFELNLYSWFSIFGALFMILNAVLDFFLTIHAARSSDVKTFWHRDITSDMLSAIAFGVAASIDFWATFQSGNVLDLLNTASIVSANIYLLSAIFSLIGKPMCKCYTSDGMLAFIGDLLFLLGSLIDVVISFLFDPEIARVNGKILYRSSAISSFLWLTDASKFQNRFLEFISFWTYPHLLFFRISSLLNC